MTDDRLLAIEARTRALGWHFINDDFTFTLLKSCQRHVFNKPGKCPAGGMWLTMGTKGYEAAERLLTAYEPVTGPVVVIENYFSKAKDWRTKVTLYANNAKTTMTGALAQCWPVPGTYRLVRCDDKENSDEAQV